MNFKSTVMPGVRAFSSTMRVKSCRERLATAVARAPFSSQSSPAKAHLRANWRVCPMTGQLQQRWSVDDSPEPPSRRITRLFQQASQMLGLFLGARTFN
ncbi:hypothetical protein [Pseudomonas nunensis]|uniref:hypothetical protein n=1 Tax=Pseudomonas nunensis TaxID=2961896 RepID=UPI0006B4FD3E|nr:hypothetical protein [Pseudomonas nunensis]KOX99607.1 hypothetical protein AM274_24500 [Pseudomonas nunensis]